MSCVDDDAKELARVGVGSCFGELALLKADNKRAAHVYAIDHVKVGWLGAKAKLCVEDQIVNFILDGLEIVHPLHTADYQQRILGCLGATTSSYYGSAAKAFYLNDQTMPHLGSVRQPKVHYNWIQNQPPK